MSKMPRPGTLGFATLIGTSFPGCLHPCSTLFRKGSRLIPWIVFASLRRSCGHETWSSGHTVDAALRRCTASREAAGRLRQALRVATSLPSARSADTAERNDCHETQDRARRCGSWDSILAGRFKNGRVWHLAGRCGKDCENMDVRLRGMSTGFSFGAHFEISLQHRRPGPCTGQSRDNGSARRCDHLHDACKGGYGRCAQEFQEREPLICVHMRSWWLSSQLSKPASVQHFSKVADNFLQRGAILWVE